ncbi:MAG: hypothetical protein LBB34_00565 [Holosporales bacterium]|jgi:hypothetical protein|nr:hypothetical protein [Holosporales bacterium]
MRLFKFERHGDYFCFVLLWAQDATKQTITLNRDAVSGVSIANSNDTYNVSIFLKGVSDEIGFKADLKQCETMHKTMFDFDLCL